jgi:acetate kinase
MRVLALNCGSSSLKFDLLEVASAGDAAPIRIASGLIDRIGEEATASLSLAGRPVERPAEVRDHAAALAAALSQLEEAGLVGDIEAVGHRVVHGGARFRGPVLIDSDVVAAIQDATELAPLHNQPALAAIEAAGAHFGGSIPMVATFDTAFYVDLPDVAATYALPHELSERLGIRRFGFHGLAHRYMVERFRALRPEIERPRLITLQLGNGCSATASLDGRPLDTSMGFTPLEGLIMGTRSGDLDPALPLLIAEKEGLSTQQVDALLNTRSGLLGLSGRSRDMRDLTDASSRGDRASDLAVRAFCYRVTKYAGAYLAVLGGADAIVFGGGIGEHSAEVRERICRSLAWAGLDLDTGLNATAADADAVRISTVGSALEAWVLRVDEAAVIGRDVASCLKGKH